jgi:hypothetical protein
MLADANFFMEFNRRPTNRMDGPSTQADRSAGSEHRPLFSTVLLQVIVHHL